MSRGLSALDDKPLQPRAQAFGRLYVEMGCSNGTAAAIAAGYSQKPECAKVQACRLLRDPRVLALIREESERRFRASVAVGSAVLLKLAEGAVSESVRLQAAQALLDRGGLQLASLSQHHVVVEDRRSEAELLARVVELQRELGVPARPALPVPNIADAVEIRPRVAPQGYTTPETAPKESIPTR